MKTIRDLLKVVSDKNIPDEIKIATVKEYASDGIISVNTAIDIIIDYGIKKQA